MAPKHSRAGLLTLESRRFSPDVLPYSLLGAIWKTRIPERGEVGSQTEEMEHSEVLQVGTGTDDTVRPAEQ